MYFSSCLKKPEWVHHLLEHHNNLPKKPLHQLQGHQRAKVLDTEQHIMTDQLATSKEQGQAQIPPVQRKAPEIPALQNPLNEERGRKRDREEATPVSGPAEQPGAKSQRINPLSEEEIFKETIESLRGERTTSPQISLVIETSTSS